MNGRVGWKFKLKLMRQRCLQIREKKWIRIRATHTHGGNDPRRQTFLFDFPLYLHIKCIFFQPKINGIHIHFVVVQHDFSKHRRNSIYFSHARCRDVSLCELLKYICKRKSRKLSAKNFYNFFFALSASDKKVNWTKN